MDISAVSPAPGVPVEAPGGPVEASAVAEAVLELVGRPGPARVKLEDVAWALGREVDELVGPVDRLLGAGRVHLWEEAPGGPALLLAAAEARKRGLAMDDDSRCWRLKARRHRRREDRLPPEPTGIRGVKVIRESELGNGRLVGGLGRLADRRTVTPSTAAMYSESCRLALASLPIGDYESDQSPQPGLYIGIGHAWDSVPFDARLCRGCGKLVPNPDWREGLPDRRRFRYRADDLGRAGAYCLACDRYGWDATIRDANRPVVVVPDRVKAGPQPGRSAYPAGNGVANGHKNGTPKAVVLKGGRG